MKLNKSQKILLILFFGIACFCGFKHYAEKIKDKENIIARISSELFDFNHIELKTDSHLNLSDFKVVNTNSGKTVFADGKYRKGIDNNYGTRSFELYYRNKKLYRFSHFSENGWYTFNYTLILNNMHNQIEPDLRVIIGEQAYNVEKINE